MSCENNQAVRLFFPRDGQTALRMPTLSNEAWMAQLLLMPKAVRPWVRNLTVRRVRPAAEELDIEVALHGDSPLASWVRRAEPGDPAGIFDIGTMYRRPEHDSRPGTVLLDAVRGATLPAGRLYAWVAGESRLATSVRRHLVNERGVSKRDISFFGYWRLGRSAPG